MKVPFKEIQGIRLISSGTTTINAGATATLDTKVITANETVFRTVFVTNNVAGVKWADGVFPSPSGDSVEVYFVRTNIANEISLVANNNNNSSSRTIRWAIIAVQL